MLISSYNINSQSLDSKLNPACIYQLYTFEPSSIASFLQTQFTGNATFYGEEAGESSNSIITLLVNSGNVSAASLEQNFKNVTDVMTAYVRETNGGAYTVSPTQGLVTQNTTCIRVVWVWISPLVIITVLSVGMFGVMVHHTRSDDAQASDTQNYKNGILPLLLHGLEAGTMDRLVQRAYGNGELEAESKGMNVRLMLTRTGWRLVEIKEG